MLRSEISRAFCVVLIGPDGSGKTTITRALLDRGDLPFDERQLVRWSFQVLPPLEPFVDWWERHVHAIPLPDASHNGMRAVLPLWQSLAITAYYALDMCLGRIVLRRARHRSLLFLFDRSFFDYHILMGHQRLPRWYLAMLGRLVPGPDLLLYIKRDAALIYRDKPELTFGEIMRQQAILDRLVARHPRGVTIDADDGVEETIERAAHCIAARAPLRDAATPSPAGVPDPCAPLLLTSRPTVVESFAETAARMPDAPALEFGDASLSYGDLRDRAWRLADALQAAGVTLDTRVAIQGERSPGMVAAMLAAWRAGGVVVMIDAEHPAERRRQLLELSGADVLVHAADVSTSPDAGAPPSFSGPRIAVDAATGLRLEGGPSASPGSERVAVRESFAPSTVAPRPLRQRPAQRSAYIFFTSGSTGTPKGVLGTHAGLAHFIEWQRTRFAVTAGDRVAFLTSVTFDVMLRDVLLPLTSGATLVIPRGEAARPDTVCTWLGKTRITIVHAVPSLARVWLKSATDAATIPSLRLTFFAGEPLRGELVTHWRRAFPLTRVTNLYGPTETTLAKCAGDVPDPAAPGVQSVGQPLPETQVLIVSEDGRLCVPEETGEIFIRTPYRTAGYVSASPADDARFMPNPFSGGADDVVYRTGDRGMYRHDGQIAVLGRVDHQIKVRGVRIEPEEVETALRLLPDVSDAVVTGYTGPGGDRELAAYVVAAGDHADGTSLRRALERVLPSYLVPSYFVRLEALPLNANGKIDRRALPDPIEWLQRSRGRQPATSLERELAALWEDVLGFAPPAVEIDFFTLGGDSLKALLLASAMTDRWHVTVPMPVLYERTTIADQARWLDGARRYDAQHVAQQHMVFGGGRDRRVFAFPPLLGYGLAYHRLAQFVPTHAFVAFDFPEDGDPIEHFADQVAAHGEEPYVLVGYSAGGNLAFDVTKALEARGRRVAAIVMLDARRFVKAETQTDDEIEAIIQGNLVHLAALMESDEQFQQFVRHDYARARLTAKMRAFLRFERGHRNDGMVGAAIHFVHSADKSPCRTWAAATSGPFHLHQGFGRHIEMAHGVHAEANGRLLAAVLAGLGRDAHTHDVLPEPAR